MNASGAPVYMGYTQCNTCVAKMLRWTLLATANYRRITVLLGRPCLGQARRGRERAGSRVPTRQWQRTSIGSPQLSRRVVLNVAEVGG